MKQVLVAASMLFLSSCVMEPCNCPPLSSSLKKPEAYKAKYLSKQVKRATERLMLKWYNESSHNISENGLPSLYVVELDNQSGYPFTSEDYKAAFSYVDSEFRDFNIVYGGPNHKKVLDQQINRHFNEPQYSRAEKAKALSKTNPEFIVRAKLSKVTNVLKPHNMNDYRLQLWLFDMYSQELVSTEWDTIHKYNLR